MKKLKLITAITFAFTLLLSVNTTAQEFKGLDKSPMDMASYPSSYKESNKLIRISYGRPQLKGRTLNELMKNGEVWRTGANEASELTLYKDMYLGDTLVKAGTYTFYMIPGEKEWTAIINKDINVWGSYYYNEANDVARLKVPVSEGKEGLEAFSIAFEKGKETIDMHLGWSKTRVVVPFKM
ncbi:DUF2911 domain-containing protein [Oceanihabitans sediminis]|uniref:DUF2911 domain-containing protein n=1 Tax=Oceanihabitans sediminis TaxID=1812012 RepID=A0A368P431_9FLAO|nr:DUF2911 domain-containing protein [Oceanihabitans sediminis]MDX1278871.1 DUF2911 domain-containing protein [Oceanihabitans sediminis]MDX1774323.1 DUF2911 domain-containing protein [Oceanihabitans sediminis]RBP29875.1 DUF2911 family protein [Oceanihabitans sediminis]RCU57213.1 DUF2911 domain-containing protein [Oceanihabitans sediminis]